MKSEYPRINKLGLKVLYKKDMPYVDRKKLVTALRKHKIVKKFSELFGIQTAFVEGPYAYDVEAVLERIYSGKLTGTQLLWD